MTHPCQYSPEVIEILRGLIHRGEWVHDPFAGTGLRLGALCTEVGAIFTAGDIEDWPDHHPHVNLADALEGHTYPRHPFTVVTSPVYQNKRLGDYVNGPLPTTKVKGRRDYGISLGRALAPNNLARHTGRESRAIEYWRLHGLAVKHWGERAIVNVDSPIATGWVDLLLDAGYSISNVIPAYTQRYRGLANSEKRAECEVVIVAERP